MTLSGWRVVTFGMSVLIVSFSSACTTLDVDIGYAPDVPVLLIDEQAVPFEVGQFIDQRQRPPHWVGEIKGTFHYPKTILALEPTVSELVRDVIEQGAYDRGMLSEGDGPSRYQFYGQIIRVDGIETEAFVVHAHLVSRLIDLEANRQIYIGEHQVKRAASFDISGTADLIQLIEEVLNEVVAASLDDPALSQVLVSIGQEGEPKG